MKALVVPNFLPNKGVVLDRAEEFLLNQFSPYSRNMEYYNDLLQGRLGLSKLDTTQLSGAVTLIDQFKEFDGTWHLMVCTTKDIYKYNFPGTGTASSFDILTPTYNTGKITIASTGSSVAITGSGTSWSSELGEGDYLKIDTGNINTLATWYEIESVENNTGCTLVTVTATCSSSGYEVRQIFQGDSTNFWRVVTFQDENLADTWIATNGVDVPVRWVGSSQVVALSNLPTGFVSAKYIDVFNNRVMFAWCVESGNQPQRERWSAVADCEDWTDTDFHDFIDEKTWITGISSLSDYHIVMKDEEGYVGRHIGGTYTFDYEKSTSCVGCKSQNSIITTQDSLFYYGVDNSFHRWNLLRDIDITPELTSDIKDFNPNLEQYIYGHEIKEKKQVRWFCPHSDTSYNNLCIVYDYENNIVEVWEYEQAQGLCCIGEYLNIEDLYVDHVVWGEYYVDEQERYWDDRVFLENAPVVLYGGYDGYLRKADQGLNDDGTAYTRKFRSVRNNYTLPQQRKRLWKQQWWFESDVGNVTIKIKKDDSDKWEDEEKIISLVNNDRDIIKESITWDKQGQDFQYQMETTGHVAMLGFLSFIIPKRRSW